MRLFTEDPDRRWLAWNEEGETPTRGREGDGGTVTEKYEGWARATKGEVRKLERRNEPSRGGSARRAKDEDEEEEKSEEGKKRIRGFSRRRVEWLGGRIIELPLIPSSPLSPG